MLLSENLRGIFLRAAIVVGIAFVVATPLFVRAH
jgi:hypothetical protein